MRRPPARSTLFPYTTRFRSDNIMVGEFGEVYLMDWGGAQILERKKASGDPDAVTDRLPSLPPEEIEGKIFGTPGYMAPEQARGGKPTRLWDVFSMGAIIYKFVMGKAPFHAEDPLVAMALCQGAAYEQLRPEKFRNILPMELLVLSSDTPLNLSFPIGLSILQK